MSKTKSEREREEVERGYLPCCSFSSGAFHLRNTAEALSRTASMPNGASLGTAKMGKKR